MIAKEIAHVLRDMKWPHMSGVHLEVEQLRCPPTIQPMLLLSFQFICRNVSMLSPGSRQGHCMIGYCVGGCYNA